MSKRAREKRVAATSAEFEEARSRASAAAIVAERTDDALFVVDRTGSKSARRKIVKEQVAQAAHVPVSKTERELLKKVQSGRSLSAAKKAAPSSGGASVLKDLWGDDDGGGGGTVTKIKKPVATVAASLAKRVAGPGFSYNPSPDAHQDVLAEALALEIQKRERDLRESKSATRIGAGVGPESLSALTRSVLVDSEDEDDDEEGEGEGREGEDGGDGAVRKAKLKEKKTRAQRNKERKRKDIEAGRSQEQGEKKLLKAIEQLPTLIKSIEKEEQKAAALRELRKVQAQSSLDTTALSYEDAGAVPLTDELSGSLRRVIPKGSNLTSAVGKFKSTGAFQFRDKFKRKKGDTMQKTRRRVWVAKHKYTDV